MPRTPKPPTLWDLAQEYRKDEDEATLATVRAASSKAAFAGELKEHDRLREVPVEVAYLILSIDHQEPPKRQHRRKVMALPERHGHIVQGGALAPRTRPPLDLPEILQQEEEVTNEP